MAEWSKAELEGFLARAAKVPPRALVFGDVNLDLIASVEGDIRGQYKQQASADSPKTSAGGKALNQATNCAKLGVPTQLIGLLGNDSLSDSLGALLQKAAKSTPCLDVSTVAKASNAGAEVRTGIGLLVQSGSPPLGVFCFGANAFVGDKEVEQVARAFNVAVPPKVLSLTLSVPMAANRQVARVAQPKGCFVALRVAPFSKAEAADVSAMLADGYTSLAFFDFAPAVPTLLGEAAPALYSFAWAREVSARVLDTFPEVEVIVICVGSGFLLRARDGQCAMQASARAATCMLPSRRHHSQHWSGAGDADGKRGTHSGIADAFLSGLMAAKSHGLSHAQSLLWAYGAAEVCLMVPGACLPDGAEAHLHEFLTYEVGARLASRLLEPSGGARARDEVAAFTPDRFLEQNVLHLAALIGLPSELPRDLEAADLNAWGDGGAADTPLEEVACMLTQPDSLGYIPLQRADEVLTRVRAESRSVDDATRRRLCRRVVDWCLNAHVLLPALQADEPSDEGWRRAALPNLLLSEGVQQHDAGPRVASGPASFASASELGRHRQRMLVKPGSAHDIFARRMRLAEQIDGKAAPSGLADATCRLAVQAVMAILDDVGHRRQARCRPSARGLRADMAVGQADAVLAGLESHETNAADGAEMALVEACCLRSLRAGTARLRAALEEHAAEDADDDDGPSLEEVLPPFCLALVEAREQVSGRTLLLLAAGAAATSLVNALLELHDAGSTGRVGSPINALARSVHGRTALHEAAACESLEICEALLRRTELQGTGITAEDDSGATPHASQGPTFQHRFLALVEKRSALGHAACCCGVVAADGEDGELGGAPSAAWATALGAAVGALEGRLARRVVSLHAVMSADTIRQAVLASDVFVVFLTPSLVLQPMSLLGMALAYDACKPLVFVELSGLPSSQRGDALAAASALDEMQTTLAQPPPLPTGLAELQRLCDAARLEVGGVCRRCRVLVGHAGARERGGVASPPAAGAGRGAAVLTNLAASKDGGDALPVVHWPVAVLSSDQEAMVAALHAGMGKAAPPAAAVREYRAGLTVSAFVSRRMSRQRVSARMQRKVDASDVRLLRRVADEAPVELPAARGELKWHVFLSHHWEHGQDVARVIKLRLKEMVSGIQPFLDVDDLQQGRGEEDIGSSALVLVFLTSGYFDSVNCMRELVYATALSVPVVVLLEPDVSKAGHVAWEEVPERLERAAAKFAQWGFDGELARTPWALPTATELIAKLGEEPLEWSRIGPFQDISLRLIAERALHASERPTFLRNALSSRRVQLPPPSPPYCHHVYVSPHNAGAIELIQELRDAQSLPALSVSTDEASLPECHCMLIYLTGRTWTSGEASVALAAEIARAMKEQVELLLVHEMPGTGGQAARHAVPFERFFSWAGGTTPPELLKRGIYRSIAIPCRGGPYRVVSLAMLAVGMASGAAPAPAAHSTQSRNRASAAPAAHWQPKLSKAASISVNLAGAGRNNLASNLMVTTSFRATRAIVDA